MEKKPFQTDSVKYLETEIRKRITWKQQIYQMAIKLNKANAILPKLEHVLDINSLRLV